MATIVVRHKVGDFATWLKGHQERETLFAPAISGFRTFQDAGDPNSIVLIVEVTDMEKLGAIINGPKNEEVKKRHTVLEPIILSMQVDV